MVNPAISAIEIGTEPDEREIRMLDVIRKKYRGPLILAGGFSHEIAEVWLEQGRADLIAFGRRFLANPDLPERFRRRAHLNADDPATYYGRRRDRIRGLPEPRAGTRLGTQATSG
jgi:N-ethylmaleimide reductase